MIIATGGPAQDGGADRGAIAVSKGKAVLWRAPEDIGSRNLIYGIGGREHQPHAPYTFVKEDLTATSPKYTVKDADGVKWKVKLGQEAKPETAATRIVWAAGFSTSEDYYLPEIQVKGVPAKLHRGRKLVDADGTMHGARLKREAEGAEKIGTWKWKSNPFYGTREFNGLRTVMGLINNWDVKDVNNAIFKEDGGQVFMVSDLGASFAAAGFAYPTKKAKGDLQEYDRATFICETAQATVDFCSLGRPGLWRMVDLKGFFYRRGLRWVGRDIPRSDARWMGGILARLSPEQIRDAFRAGGYSADEAEGFARVVERRIGALNEL